MMQDPFRVGYLEPPMYPSFLEAIASAGLEAVPLPAGDDATRIAALAECDGYYVRASRDELPPALHVTHALLARLPRLRLVACYGAGYDTVDVAACTAAGVAAVNQAGGNAQAVAEHAVGMMLGLLKRMPQGSAALRAGAVGDRRVFLGGELAGRTVGIVGLGHTGSRTAALVGAFGCRVLAVDPYLDAATFRARGAEPVDWPTLLVASDVIAVHCPLTAETRGLFDAARFAAMKPGAIFVNTARGSTYDEPALAAALASGHLAGAGLDVWEREPPPPDHPLLQLPCVIATPHTAGVTHESRDRVARLAAEAFAQAAAGELSPRCLNPEVGRAWRARGFGTR